MKTRNWDWFLHEFVWWSDCVTGLIPGLWLVKLTTVQASDWLSLTRPSFPDKVWARAMGLCQCSEPHSVRIQKTQSGWAPWGVLKPQRACFVIQGGESGLGSELLLSRVITGVINEILSDDLSRWSPGPPPAPEIASGKLKREAALASGEF